MTSKQVWQMQEMQPMQQVRQDTVLVVLHQLICVTILQTQMECASRIHMSQNVIGANYKLDNLNKVNFGSLFLWENYLTLHYTNSHFSCVQLKKVEKKDHLEIPK